MAQLQQVVESLQLVLSPDPSSRHSAEQQLEQLSACPGYSCALVQVFLDQAAYVSVRQAAVFVLKHVVKTKWDTILEQDRNFVKAHLPSALKDGESRLRQAAANILAVVGTRFPS